MSIVDKFAPKQIRDLTEENKKRDLISTRFPPPEEQARFDEIEEQLAKHTQRGQDPIAAIQAWLRLLTHRQMRDLVAAIYRVHKSENAITAAELPDVLDRFAYGE
jgi:hypothetical protein